MRYMPKLDGLRAIAVALVLLQHFAPPPVSLLGTGGIGVRVFFVLSGFLITALLLADRNKANAKGFYWRRFLRLTPALWIAIATAAALGIGNMRADWWVHGFYLSNFLVAVRGTFGPVGHFWTRAVEEQFYLLWFAVVVVLPRKALLHVIIACLFIGPVYRGGLYLAGLNNFWQTLLPGNIDSLAAGALLAATRGAKFWRPWMFWIGLAGVVSLGALPVVDPWRRIFYPDFVNLAALALVAMGADGKRLEWLGWAPLRHLGVISYGLYVYHYFVPLAIPGFSGWFGLMFYTTVSLILAEASWWMVERPIKSLRNKALDW